jgi:hypothetical protein
MHSKLLDCSVDWRGEDLIFSSLGRLKEILGQSRRLLLRFGQIIEQRRSRRGFAGNAGLG